MSDPAPLSAIIDGVADVLRGVRPRYVWDSATVDVGEAVVWEVPPDLDVQLRQNSWVLDWSLSAIGDLPGYGYSETWTCEMYWFGRGVTANPRRAYVEATAVLDAAMLALRRPSAASLGGLVDVTALQPSASLIDVDMTQAHRPQTVHLSLQIERTVYIEDQE